MRTGRAPAKEWKMKTSKRSIVTLGLVMAGLFGAVATSQAATITVQNTADSGVGSLRQAVADANSGDTIKFDPSVSGTITFGSRIKPLVPELTIVGPGAGKLTLSGGQQTGTLESGQFLYSKLTLSGLTVANAVTAISWVGDLTVSDCVFRDNVGFNAPGSPVAGSPAAALDCIFGNVVLTRCSFLNNTGHDFGGAINFNDEQLTINQCNFRNNSSAGYGGAIMALDAIVTITNSTFANNSSGRGGAIFHGPGSHTSPAEASSITRSTFSGNTALFLPSSGLPSGYGGAIVATAALNTCTLSGNTAQGTGGGAIYGAVTLANSTVAGNSAPSGSGGGVFTPAGNATTAYSTIIAGNTAATGPDISGEIVSQDYNLIQNTDGATITGATAHDKYGVDPLLGSLTGYGGPTETRPLLAGSPAIDGGNPVETATTDQRGLPRLKDGDGNGSLIADIGAFEVQSTVAVSGRVSTSNGIGVVGASVRLGGLSVQSNGAGYFTFKAVPPGGYVVRPSYQNLEFTPGSRTVYVAATAISGQNFVGGHSIQGRVANSSGIGLANVKVTRSGSATPVFTNGAGYYVFPTLVPGSYTVTPVLAGNVFTPATRTVDVTTFSASGQNFVASSGFTVNGRIANSAGIGLVGVTVTLNTGATAVSNGAGYYTFANVPNGSYTLTPSQGGTVFSPATKNATVSGGNVSGLNFLGTNP